MRESDWFDTFLQESLEEIPPEEMVRQVTPWRKATTRILVGLALTAITFNFALLNYILPAIGVVLMLLGFRTLRRENKWFQMCFNVTAFQVVILAEMLVMNSTIYHSEIYASGIGTALTFLNLAILFVQLIGLWQGLRALQQKAGVPVHAGSGVALIIWNAMITLFGFWQWQTSLFGALILITAYICIIRSLFKLSKELDEAGYVVKPASVRLPDRILTILLLIIVSVGMAGGFLFGGSYKMNWTPVEEEVTSQTEEIKAHLISLGFPENVLEDLTEEEILDCEGAKRVVVEMREHPVNEGRLVTEKQVNTTITHRVYDVNELQLTNIAVELPDEREHWKLFQHFLWTVNPGFHGTESLQFWPVYRMGEGWSKAEECSGRLLYDKDGETFASPYHTLEEETYTSNSWFLGEQVSTDVFATFSLPDSGENQRGYVTYTVKEMSDGWIISSWINYTHQKHWWQYPVKTALEHRKTEGFSSRGAFITVQDAVQFNPTLDETEIVN